MYMKPSQSELPPLQILEPGDGRYPPTLPRLLGSRAPQRIYSMGNLDLLTRPGVGFCGSRKASAKGLGVAADCAGQLARQGFVVISGYAAGVDSAAHKAALEAGGLTIVVLPEGLDHFRIRKTLTEDWDWSRVLVLSPFASEAVWRSYQAMQRNDIVIALSRAMIVIEAGATGGTLQAGLSTRKLGLPLFVVDYDNMNTEAPGNAELIRLGGQRLRKSSTTGAANVSAIVKTASAPLVLCSMHSATLPLACAPT